MDLMYSYSMGVRASLTEVGKKKESNHEMGLHAA